MKKSYKYTFRRNIKSKKTNIKINNFLSLQNSYTFIAGSIGYISEKQIKFIERLTKRYSKKTGKFLISVIPKLTLTKKSNAVRMGKGKGKKYKVVFPIRVGLKLFFFKGLRLGLASKFLSKSYKVNTNIFK